MITQEELENLGFVYQGSFNGIERYKFSIPRKDLYFTDTYSEYYFEEDSSATDKHRLYGRIVRGMDHNQPTYERKTTYTTIDQVEEDLKRYLKKDLRGY